ncbi:MAG: monovalent cation/H(+) antiporter subunit G [Actinomycetes bacterium]|nr:monovalent cation/H(+) antiporter subunit G [Actinomycetes bacterium]MDX5380723.1 monovalent cation/H(+) antiporter subunit G [Actinomycetes bacterium]MDX5399718.1 monovalent cation/H(+) antiporter subunit G [Actinomycetes bacterium]MDX5450461.1 monovalent cation/H(+) antiporter subunit G [Actinomycetes bacterium]
MTPLEVAALAILALGCAFYGAGTIGLLRFPDVFTRLHALTKADNVGLFLVGLSMALLADGVRAVLLILLVWVAGLVTATTSASLLARHARTTEEG